MLAAAENAHPPIETELDRTLAVIDLAFFRLPEPSTLSQANTTSPSADGQAVYATIASFRPNNKFPKGPCRQAHDHCRELGLSDPRCPPAQQGNCR